MELNFLKLIRVLRIYRALPGDILARYRTFRT